MTFLLLPVLESPGLRVHYESPDAARAAQAAEVVREVEADIAARLGVAPPAPLDVYLAENDAAFGRRIRDLSGGGAAPEWALAVAIPAARAVVVRTSRLEVLGWNDLRPTLAHEIAHLALDRAGPLPRWLDEGLAMWAEGRRLTREEQTTLERLARNDDLYSLADLAREFPPHAAEAQLSYLESLAFVQSLEQAAAPAIRALLRLTTEGVPFERAFQRAFDAPVHGYELTWRADLARHYSFWRDIYERGSLFSLVALLTVVAFVRYWCRRRRLLAEMGRQESAEPPSFPNEGNIDG